MASDLFVSRGGEKLQAALIEFQIDVSGKVVLDLGSSTGGFVDCLLQNGASKVYSVDTAYGELAWKLRNDPRVVVMERTNALFMPELPEKVDLITIDASWTKLEKIIPAVSGFLKEDGIIIALLKPHYEANKKDLIKGILPTEIAEQVKKEVIQKLTDLGYKIKDSIESPIKGGAGNIEYLLYVKH